MLQFSLARQRLHAAAQWLSRLGYAYAIRAADDSHGAADWRDGKLWSAPLGPAELPASLDAVNLKLTLGSDDIALNGLDEAGRHKRVGQLLKRAGLDPSRLDEPLPWEGEAPVAVLNRDACVMEPMQIELAAHYQAASGVLKTLADAKAGSSPVKLWPHHFDIATLITINDVSDEVQTIGVGLAPDDTHFTTPYLYVSPWPKPPGPLRSPLPGWRWHEEGFTALVLPLDHGHQAVLKADIRTAFAIVRGRMETSND
jgi:hypothetical protein